MRLIFLFLISLSILSISCTKPPIEGPSKILIPWPTENGTYSLQVVEVKTLKDSVSVSGDAAQLFMEPTLGDDGLHGNSPSAHFTKTNEGVLIPTDFLTSQFAGIYAHAEKLWDLDQEVGVDTLLKYPQKYGVKSRVYKEGSYEYIKNNAMYVARGDSTLIMPYEGDASTPYNQLPLPLNGGVLAHEHFHALFNAIMGQVIQTPKEVLDKGGGFLECAAFDSLDDNKKKTSDKPLIKIGKLSKVLLHNTLVMRGINEGLADVWGWIYSGDDKFILHSLPDVGTTRALDVKGDDDFMSTQEFSEKANLFSDQGKTRLSYTLGTQVARMARQQGRKLLNSGDSSGNLNREERLEFAKLILSAMPELKKLFADKIKTQTLIETTSLNDVLFTLKAKNKLDKTDCVEIQKAMSHDEGLVFKETNCTP